ncbi:hypothetical protein Tco_1019564 [Tanacetum coccineum]|uniref:Uncharacterized protein n=1 Tax=Tanacetum coccineum TaxID=301880 RepID=A0ABQ5FXY5_9ASTR
MAEENVPAPAPTRSDEHILPFQCMVTCWKGQSSLGSTKIAKESYLPHLNSAHPFVSPPAGHQAMDFVNELGYPKEIHFVSKMHEELVQAIQIFFAHRANLNIPAKKPTPHVIPYYRFTKLIIFYFGSEHNIHRRPKSPVHVTGDDFLLGNLKFVPKGEKDEYLEMVARKPTAKEGGQKKITSKADKPKRPTPVKQPALVEQIKPVKEKPSKPTPLKKIRKGKVMKVCKEKRSDRLVDEEDEEPQPASEPHVEDDEYNLQRGITQRLLVAEGKGKGIATDEQVAHSLLELQKPKKQSTTDQYIFQRRIPVTQDAPTGPSAQPQDDTSKNVVRDTPSPADAETGADTEKSNSEVELDEGQAGSDPGNTLESPPSPDEDQAGSNPRQRHHTTEEHIYIENPLSSSETLSSMKNLDDALTFGDQFLNDKPIEEDSGKANVETEVESMVTVSIHQAPSSAPPLSTPIIDLTPPKPISPSAQEPVFTAKTATTTTTLLPPPPPQQQSTTVPELATRYLALEKICANFEKKYKLQDKTTQALSSRVFRLENHDLYLILTVMSMIPSQPEHAALYDALEVSMDRKNREEFIEATTSSTWKTSDIRESPSSSSKQKTAPQSEQPVNDVPIPNDVHISNLEDIGAAHLPKIKTRPDWLKPVPEEEERPKTPEPDWAIGKSKLRKADLEGPAFKLVRPFHKNNISLQFQMEECHLLLTDQIDLVNPEGNRIVSDVSKPLPLGGPPGQVTIQPQYFFNKDLEYLVSGDKDRRNALSISKLKAAYYQDFRLKELVPSLWIESEREYDISTAYGISHWWFKRKEFYITRHSAPFDRHAFGSHMKIFSVVSLKTFSRYGNLNHLSSADKVYLFNAINLWIRNIVIRQRVEDLQLGIESYQTKLNLTQPSWDATDFLFKEDYTIIHKPRAVMYRDRNNQKKMMTESEVQKFSDCTLTIILEKLDHMVKDYTLFKFYPDMEHRIWSEDDKSRSKEFIVIERRLKIRRIFRSLESFVSGRLRDVDYRLIQRTE